MTSRENIKDVTEALLDIALMLAWGAWAFFVFWLGLVSDAVLIFAGWFWPSIGDWLVNTGVPKDLLLTQLMLSHFSVMLLVIAAPIFLWVHFIRKNRKPYGSQTGRATQLQLSG